MKMPLTLVMVIGFAVTASAQELPPGYWPLAKSQAVLDKSETTRLAPSLSHLTAREKSAVADLLEAGQIFQDLYELSRHHQAIEAREKLVALDKQLKSPAATQNLLKLYRLNQGPIG